MASKSSTSAALFLFSNLIFFAFANANNVIPITQPITCPIEELSLRVCVNLAGLVGVVVGNPPAHPCCSLISSLTDLQAAVCLCAAIKANILGIVVDADVAITAILNNCRRSFPTGYECDQALSPPPCGK